MFWKTLCIVILLTLNSGCSMLASKAADMALGGSEPGLEVDANVGQAKTEGDDSVAQNANTAVQLSNDTKEEFNGAVGTVVNEAGLPIHVLLLLVLLAGWAIPSPEEMGHGIIRLIRALRKPNQ